MSDEKKILEEAFKFHGHICWASAAGTRAGLAALRTLGVKRAGASGDLHCILEIGENHGAQCFADGVQYSTGCTLGKWNIEKTGWGKLAFTLIDKKNQKAVRVSYRPGPHHKKVAESSFMRKRGQGIPPTEIPEEEAWEMVDIIWETPENEILTIGDVHPYEWEEFGEILGLVPCDQCGELVSKVYLRVVGKSHMCIPCSGYER
ncbi:MAG: formylmethanofuran dehydrogenase [Deltaproteobacteria bacterium]|nr:formylmethanofuran dehydrogenase [Deltaproteobacteria bacterium]MBW2152282.1 formylmethanofuran dehydrogenase [Deltaproteobacteria bacterium]